MFWIFMRYLLTIMFFSALIFLVVKFVPIAGYYLRTIFLSSMYPVMSTADRKGYRVFLPLYGTTMSDFQVTQGIYLYAPGKEIVLEIPFNESLVQEFPKGYLLRSDSITESQKLSFEYRLKNHVLYTDRESAMLVEMLEATDPPDTLKFLEFEMRKITAYFDHVREKDTLRDAIQWVHRVLHWIVSRVKEVSNV